jgi:hypothetical protein
MSEIEALARAYERFVALPWERALAGPQKVWFAIYEPAHERRVRLRIRDFETATRAAGHGWVLLDITDAFAEWMAGQEYREAYFEDPTAMDITLPEFAAWLSERVRGVLAAPDADDNTVVAIAGVASLFGLMHASNLLRSIAPAIRGRLLVFFPGRRDGSSYRLLDARDGWDYLAVPITATEEK